MSTPDCDLTIADFDKICRFCFARTDLKSLFYMNLHQIVNDLAQLKILQNDDLPKHICNSCSERFQTTWFFINQCRKSEQTLRHIATNKPIEQTNNEIVHVKVETRVENESTREVEELIFLKKEDSKEDDNPLLVDDSSNDYMEENDIQPEVVKPAKPATSGALPEKSRNLYEKEYTCFTKWCSGKEVVNFSENVLLDYFLDKSGRSKASSLWSYYSMLKATIMLKHNIDISKFSKLIAFLKSKSESHTPKESKVLNRNQIETFIREAPNNSYLMIKVALIIGITGGCRRDELTKLTVDDIEDLGSALIVQLRESTSRTFTVLNNKDDFLGIYRKYLALRPRHIDHKRFFVCYKNGKCSTQPVGKNTFGLMPAKVAEYLKLPNHSSYTGRCFRRASADRKSDPGTNIQLLRQLAGWNSPSVSDSLESQRNSAICASTSRMDCSEDNETERGTIQRGQQYYVPIPSIKIEQFSPPIKR